MLKFVKALLPAILFSCLLYAFSPLWINDIENRTIDYRFLYRGNRFADQRIVIIGIDQNSVSKINRPFFTYGPILADLTNSLVDCCAAGIMFDVIFPASSESAIKEHIASIASRLGLDLPHGFIREIGFEKPFRAALIRAMTSKTALTIGVAMEPGQEYSFDKTILRIVTAENTGYFNLPVDRDGKIRRALPFQKSATGETLWSVGLRAAVAIASQTASNELEGFRQINYAGPAGTFKTIPLYEVLQNLNDSEFMMRNFKGKLVLFGFTDITDFKSTPYGYMPGVEIHANIISNILNKNFLQKPELFVEIICMALFLFLIAVLSLRKITAGIVLNVIVVAGWLIYAFSCISISLVPIARPVTVLLFLVLNQILIYVHSIREDRKRITRIFGRYVNDSVLKEVLNAPDESFIAGKRGQLCILMADIRGFTSYSEGREASEVVAFLNSYFTKLTEIILKYDGVVDKFLGDGILAFFNAPVSQPGFVDKAVKAALEIIQYANSPEFGALSGDYSLKIGLALHSGPVVFGNIGSEKKAEFTVIGDAVNACSRMESLNKVYSTSIILSEQVVKNCTLDLRWKALESRTLRGKTEEVSLFTIN